MFCVANISVMFTLLHPKGAISFSHILMATFGACEYIHKVVAFAVNFLSNSVFLPSGVASDFVYPF